MTERMKLLASAAALALGVAATGALADDTWYSDWDTDGDGALSQEEWTTGLDDADVHASFDSNADGTLDEDEWGEDLVDLDGSVDDTFDMDSDQFAESTYDAYDVNDDGMLDNEELGAAEEDFGSVDAI